MASGRGNKPKENTASSSARISDTKITIYCDD